jgi:hypothetical protein
MNNRRLILFKISGEVVVEEPNELTISEIEEWKWNIAQCCSCHIEDIDVEYEDFSANLSEMDVTANGMVYWKDVHFIPIRGVHFKLEIGSDEYLDALSNGTLHEYLTLI